MSQKDERFPGFPSKPITNYWRCPRVINGWWHTLTPTEQSVLFYILRHTWGYNKTSDEISLTQIESGIKGYDGGTGLSRATIIKSIKGLIGKGFIEKSVGRYANRYALIIKDLNHNNLKFKLSNSLRSKHTKKDKPKKDTKITVSVKTSSLSSKEAFKREIIKLYAGYKGVEPGSPQYTSFFKRNVKPVELLQGYKEHRIKQVMLWLSDNTDFPWKLETVAKFIDEDLGRLKPWMDKMRGIKRDTIPLSYKTWVPPK